jgi:hypothetical protein
MPKLRIDTHLAKVFARIADSEQSLESTASGILALVKEHAIRKIEQWDEVVAAAYEKNGWNTRAGRPNGDVDPKLPVPSTVSSYVALVRQAIRAKLRLSKFDSFTALRVALAKRAGRTDHRGSRRATAERPAPIRKLLENVAESFVGVDIQQAEPNGALFHDLGVVYARLPTDHQAMLGRQLSRLLHKYLPLVVDDDGAKRKAA